LWHKKKRESEGGKSKHKKIVMVNLIIQKKTGTATTKSSVCSIKVLDLLLWHPILVSALGILGFVRKGTALLSDSLGWR
jgi:hypothetical protein